MTTTSIRPADPLDRFRSIAENAFRRIVPQQCSDAWLAELSGPARYDWDVDAMQVGFVEPLYAHFHARPERLRAALTIALVDAGDVADHETHFPLYAALELAYLAGCMLTRIRNGKTHAEATPDDSALPLSMLSTLAFTSGTFAADLVARRYSGLPLDRRLWLVHRFARCAYQAGVGAAVDNHFSEQKVRIDSWEQYSAHLMSSIAPHTFVVSVEAALAILGLHATPTCSALCEAARHAGIGYQLATELLMRHTADDGLLPLEPALRWSFGEALSWPDPEQGERHAWHAAERALQTAHKIAKETGGPLARRFMDFVDASAGVRLQQAGSHLRA